MSVRYAALSAIFLLLAAIARSAGDTPAPGKVIQGVTCLHDTTQSYALYLPSYYDTLERYPVIYAFDPAGRGSLPVELYAPAAEKYGYIIAGSNNAENGPWEPILAAADAMFRDTRLRLAIDGDRIYTTGFSGSSRAAASLAVLYRFIKGVIGCGAGFSPSYRPHFDLEIQYYGLIGIMDHNFQEMLTLDAWLEKYQIPHFISQYYGMHEWPPPEQLEDAVLWMDFRAMENDLRYVDYHLVYDFYNIHFEKAKQMEAEGLIYDACREYMKIQSFLQGIKPSGEVRDRINELMRDPAYLAEQIRQNQVRDREKALISEYVAAFASYEASFSNSTVKAMPIPWWKDQVAQANAMLSNPGDPLTALLGQRIIDYIWRTAYMKYEDVLGTEYEPLVEQYLAIWSVARPEAAAPYFLLGEYYTRLGKAKKAETAFSEGIKRNL
jgi:hypothetical protein